MQTLIYDKLVRDPSSLICTEHLLTKLVLRDVVLTTVVKKALFLRNNIAIQKNTHPFSEQVSINKKLNPFYLQVHAA